MCSFEEEKGTWKKQETQLAKELTTKQQVIKNLEQQLEKVNANLQAETNSNQHTRMLLQQMEENCRRLSGKQRELEQIVVELEK